ncbi:MAG: 16S rRNA (cytosine(967)-C(5))-methyltransferase [Cyanobacteriota bacterium]|nr:16S rRNA (cytosine(967)-C(5))-methyltransferase [Cyanobacteriota bacterium]
MADASPHASTGEPPGLAPRLLAWRVLEAVGDGAYADLALERELCRLPLAPADRALATDLAYGAIRQRRRLDAWIDRLGRLPALRQPPRLRWLLHVGLQQLLAMDRVPASAAVSTTVELAKRQRLASLAPVVNGVLRAALRAREAGEGLPLPADPCARLALEQSWPDALLAHLWTELGAERCTALAVASNHIPAIDLRVNRLRSSREQVLAAFVAAGVEARPLDDLPDAIALGPRPGPLARLPGFGEGHWSVQDRAAQRIAPLLQPRPGQRLLDVCAAPGGKATHLAELLGDNGSVVALDCAERRLERLEANAQRLGLGCLRPVTGDGTRWHDPDGFDGVLLDVPCSGLGTLARHPDARWGLSPASWGELLPLQAALLDQAARLLRPGGRLVYATCTLHPAENEGQVNGFLARHGGWQLQQTLELWPGVEGGDGFYAAVLEPPAG